ncbi:hypothetical protein D3C71_2245290 [compost metagenome]
MTYEEAIEENPTISRAVAERECKTHSVKFAEMLADLGDKPEYEARDVLIWLGY